MLKDNTIKLKVMSVIKDKIAVAQESYEKGCRRLEDQLIMDKSDLADKKVEEIVGKLI
ncbi:MAG: hypothetical protein KAS32_12525 [Candidatus Peribacteraceae bacterium]|nr:hypothetical protein [Candidatus Peribacteraceae bacterium]